MKPDFLLSRFCSEEDIKQRKKYLEMIKKQSRELEATVEKNMQYQRYLDQVQEENPEEYPEISDLLNRYKVIFNTICPLKLYSPFYCYFRPLKMPMPRLHFELKSMKN